jgi:ketosteroid isomerase-like protein
MWSSELEQVMKQDHRALAAFVRGDPGPKKELFSRLDDITVANPFGPPARGWNQVAEALEGAAAQLREGEPVGFERVSGYATADLAYIVELERYRIKVGGGDDLVPVSLRVTTIFRREDDGWRVAHRHADPITAPRPPESLMEQQPGS